MRFVRQLRNRIRLVVSRSVMPGAVEREKRAKRSGEGQGREGNSPETKSIERPAIATTRLLCELTNHLDTTMLLLTVDIQCQFFLRDVAPKDVGSRKGATRSTKSQRGEGSRLFSL